MLSVEEIQSYGSWIVSVAKTGSSILPWICNPRDTDYVFYVNDMSRDDLLLDLLKHKPTNECWLVDSIHRDPVIRYYEYQNSFRQLVYGEWLPDLDVLQNLQRYKQVLICAAFKKPYDTRYKLWYHILTGIYLIHNRSYQLNPEQSHNVQICHNFQMTPALYAYIQDSLQQFNDEFNNLV